MKTYIKDLVLLEKRNWRKKFERQIYMSFQYFFGGRWRKVCVPFCEVKDLQSLVAAYQLTGELLRAVREYLKDRTKDEDSTLIKANNVILSTIYPANSEIFLIDLG